MGNMKDVMDFLSAAFPWICIGLFIAIVIVRSSLKKDDEDEKANFGSEGMALGMCFGTAIGAALGFNTGFGMIAGMIIGFAIGLSIEKKDDAE